VSWAPQGGQLLKVSAAGGVVQQLSKLPALYQNPAFDNSGNRIVFLRTPAQRYKDAIEVGYEDAEDELCWIPAAGGEITLIEKPMVAAILILYRGGPHLSQQWECDLLSIKWDGTDEKNDRACDRYHYLWHQHL